MNGLSALAILGAILDLLLPLKEELGLKDVAMYQGQFASARNHVMGKTPFVWAAYTGSPDFEETNRRIKEVMEFEIWLGDKDYSGKRDGHAHHGGPGTFAMLEAVRSAVMGVCPAKGVGPLKIKRIDALAYSGASLYRLRLTTEQNISVR